MKNTNLQQSHERHVGESSSSGRPSCEKKREISVFSQNGFFRPLTPPLVSYNTTTSSTTPAAALPTRHPLLSWRLMAPKNIISGKEWAPLGNNIGPEQK